MNIIADYYVGSLVGYNIGTVLYCFADGRVLGDEDVGGLVGYNKGTVSRCYARVDTSGHYQVGGLIGVQYSGMTNECYAAGLVSDLGSSSYYTVGGFIGYCWGSGAVTNSFWDKQKSGRSGTITNCGVTGWIRGDGLVGGLVGQNQGLIKTSCSEVHIVSQGSTAGGLVSVNSGTIQACYAQGQGEVSGWSARFAGLVGSNSGYIEKNYAAVRTTANSGTARGLCAQNTGTVLYSFWDTEFSEQTLSAAGQRRTTAQMVQELTYLNWNTSTAAPWIIDENQNYPRLYWENTPG